MGINAAYRLAVRGLSVHVVDKGEVGMGSSYGNAGLVVPSHSIPLPAPGVMAQGLRWMFNQESPFYIKPRLDRQLASWLWKFRGACSRAQVERAVPVICELSMRSVGLFEELAALPGLEFDFEQCGILLSCPDQETMKEGEKEAAHLRHVGLEVDILDGRQVAGLDVGVEVACVGGVYFHQDGHLSPYRFVSGLARKANEAGAELHPQTEVLGFDRRGGQLAAVRTTRGVFAPRQVVLATGSWTPGLAAALGLRLPIQPAKGYSITFARPSESPRLPIMLAGAKVAVTPMGDKLRFAGTLELAGMDFSINRRRVEAIMKAVPQQLPQLDPRGMQLEEIWRGLRPCTPDGLPFIGRARGRASPRNLVVAAGHAMIGLSLGPITGHLVSQVVLDEKPDVELAPLAVDRFA